MNLSNLILALFLVCGSLPALAQDLGGAPPHEDRQDRWKDMKKQRKQDMRKRFDRLHDMDADKRQTKLERAKRLREIMTEIYARMDADTKKRVDAMSASEKSTLLGRLALEEARSRSREARLVLGSKEQKSASRKGFKAKHDEFLQKARKRMRAHVKKNGLPKGVTQKEWETFQKLKGHKFGRKLRKLVEKNPELVKVIGAPPGQRQISREHWELHRAMRIPQREHMRMLGPHKRSDSKKEMTSRRKRVMSVLQKNGMLDPALKKVETLTDKEFMGWVRQRIGPKMRPGGEGGREHRPRMGPEGRPPRGADRHPPGVADRHHPEGRGHRPPREARDHPRPRGPGLRPHPKGTGPPKGPRKGAPSPD